MQIAQFPIVMETPEGEFRADIFVYDTDKALTKATRIYDAKYHLDDTVETLGGVTHRYKRYKDDELQKDLGIIRLSQEHLGIGVVSHEATHLAVHVYDSIWDEPIEPDDDEEFAYLLGDIVRQIVNGLYETNCYENLKQP